MLRVRVRSEFMAKANAENESIIFYVKFRFGLNPVLIKFWGSESGSLIIVPISKAKSRNYSCVPYSSGFRFSVFGYRFSVFGFSAFGFLFSVLVSQFSVLSFRFSVLIFDKNVYQSVTTGTRIRRLIGFGRLTKLGLLFYY